MNKSERATTWRAVRFTRIAKLVMHRGWRWLRYPDSDRVYGVRSPRGTVFDLKPLRGGGFYGVRKHFEAQLVMDSQ